MRQKTSTFMHNKERKTTALLQRVLFFSTFRQDLSTLVTSIFYVTENQMSLCQESNGHNTKILRFLKGASGKNTENLGIDW